MSGNKVVNSRFFGAFDNGNSPSGTLTLGTNNANNLAFETNTTTHLLLDTSGNLNILNRNELRLQDSSGGQYVGLIAPSTVTNYTIELPAADAPDVHRSLRLSSGGTVSYGPQIKEVTNGTAIRNSYIMGNTTAEPFYSVIIGRDAGANYNQQFVGTNEDDFGSILIGYQAGTTSDGNSLTACVAIGNNSQRDSTTGSTRNMSIGNCSMQRNTSGKDNMAIGVNSLHLNTTGDANVAVGTSALFNSLFGSKNIAIGEQANISMTTNSDTIAIGQNTAVLGDQSVAIGNSASIASNVTSGVAIGTVASLTSTATSSVAIGDRSTISQGRSVAIGANSSVTATQAVAIGQGASSANSNSMALGFGATTSATNQIVLGNSSVTKIRAEGDGNCDLGDSTHQFNDVHSEQVSVYGADTDAVVITRTSGSAWTLTLPTDAGSSGQVLVNQGSGTVAWDSVGGVDSDAQNNTVAGTNAGDSFSGTSATNNSLFGYNAGTGITTGDFNTIVGSNAGTDYDIGLRNTIIGFGASQFATSANDNTIVGYQSHILGTGGGNTCVGKSAGDLLTTGTDNVVIGADADCSATISNVVSIGHDASVTGSNGIAIGDSVTAAGNEIVIGNASSTVLRTMGNGVCDLGGSSNQFNDAHIEQVLIYGSDTNAITFTRASGSAYTLTFPGSQGAADQVLSNNGSGVLSWTDVSATSIPSDARRNVVGLGDNAGDSITTGGFDNTCVGDNAGTAITSGDNNVCLGSQAGSAINTGGSNVVIGYNAGLVGDYGFNVIIGTSAGDSITSGGNSVIIGYEAGAAITTTGNNHIIGRNAGSEFTGERACFFGDQAARYGTGFGNTAIGDQAFRGVSGSTTAERGTFLGLAAGFAITTGSANTCIGYASGIALTTGGDNTFVGENTDTTVASVTNSIALGHDATVDASNLCVIGDANLNKIRPTGDGVCDLGDATHQFNDVHTEQLLVYGADTDAVTLSRQSGAAYTLNLPTSQGTNGYVLAHSGTDDLVWTEVATTNAVDTISANTTLSSDNFLVKVDTSVTVTLPDNASNEGQEYIVVNIAAVTTTIDTSGSDTLDDGSTASVSISNIHDKIRVISGGNGVWYIV